MYVIMYGCYVCVLFCLRVCELFTDAKCVSGIAHIMRERDFEEVCA